MEVVRKINKIPYIVSWNITNRCNQQCKHCKLPFNKGSNELSTKEVFNIIDKLQHNVFLVSFTGGEPLVREDFFSILEYLSKKNIGFLLASNGLLINEEKVRTMKNMGMRSVAISLDSHIRTRHDVNRGKNSFEKALKAIETVKKEELGLIISTIVDNNNLKDLPEFIKFAHSLGAEKIKVQVVLGNKNSKYRLSLNSFELFKLKEIVKKSEEQLDLKDYIRYSCYTNYLKYDDNSVSTSNISVCNSSGNKLTIQPNGDVVACEFYPNLKLGNLLNEDFYDIHSFSKKSVFCQKRIIIGECKNCPHLDYCKGGCKLFAPNSNLSNNIFSDQNCPINLDYNKVWGE